MRRAPARRGTALALLAALVAAGCGGGSRPPAPAAGAEPPSCRPSPQHPEPIVLVRGTFAATSWALLGPALAERGYCVFRFAYGNDGTADIVTSAHELARFVDRLLARTRASKVSIVGHSEGGLMPRYYIRFLGGAAKVDDLVGLAPSNHGTDNPLALEGALLGCTACGQQLAWGSTFLSTLNAGDETPPPVDYTTIETAYDEVVVPYTSAFLSGPAARVTNVTLQARCPDDFSGHLDITLDPVALQWVENALSRRGPADPGLRPNCSAGLAR